VPEPSEVFLLGLAVLVLSLVAQLGARPNIGEIVDSLNGGHGLSEELSGGWHADGRLSNGAGACDLAQNVGRFGGPDKGLGGWLCAFL
jgi:hypothetical protein